ncbi:class I SAM-dependent methyltransferase [Pseudomonas tructae]|uniref:Class I SAM-dependent methyltransferase n=1 Tax=Pseudomonas tructae TaxID=2518644 RepID=A0A411MJ03_9PSED|nr:class I SAM-dependent methyltransferase [Pseudomonas tructae]QBF26775.1 class I SAM-dependent methyltransferase [Pseudomonas tructae]
MELTAEQLQADSALLQLGRRLIADGYTFTCVTPVTQQRNLERTPANQSHSLRDVFGWNRSFFPGNLSPDELKQMWLANILDKHGSQLRSTVRFSTLGDWLFLHSGYPTLSHDAVFFGPDSYRFAHVIQAHLQRDAGEINHAIEIGCGTGIGAILIATARRHAQVTAVDINDLALRYTAINVALAELANVSIEHSDVLHGITGTFDLIVCNPPYMLDAGERTYRHGGGTLGEGLALRIVEESLERLAAGGTLLLYSGSAIVDGQDPFYNAVKSLLQSSEWVWSYQEVDPDVFGEQLLEPGYQYVERIAAVSLSVTRRK